MLDNIENTSGRNIFNYSSANTNLTIGNQIDEVTINATTTISKELHIFSSTKFTLGVGNGISFSENGTVQFGNNSGTGKAPTLAGIVTDNNRPPFQIMVCGPDTNSGADLFFNVRKFDVNDFNTHTGGGFEGHVMVLL